MFVVDKKHSATKSEKGKAYCIYSVSLLLAEGYVPKGNVLQPVWQEGKRVVKV